MTCNFSDMEAHVTRTNQKPLISGPPTKEFKFDIEFQIAMCHVVIDQHSQKAYVVILKNCP